MASRKQPDPLVTWIGHALVGGAVAIIVGKAAKAAAPALLLGLFAALMHAEFDAPVSQALSNIGL